MVEKNLLPDVRKKIKDITDLFSELNRKILKPIKHYGVWLERLEESKKLIVWTIEKHSILFRGFPNYVHKKEIFYCKLGYNIGSEQSGVRPVVILQNDKGNINSPTTIVAPITLHRGSIEKTESGHIIKSIDEEGREKIKKLDYYEVPVRLEDGYKKEVKGFVNVAQIRTISKKRLDGMPVGKITNETLERINEAIKINLEL